MAPRTETRIARNGRPSFVHRVKILGAWPLRARPYKSRDAPNRIVFPDEKALEKTQALIIWGKTGREESKIKFVMSSDSNIPRTPARSIAITKGDCAAVPVPTHTNE